ncbi:bifunctional 5,10-methylene-tetrahydrofolate dehydrogenase/5,10-methylene-tetrahydrofolate cyclohydrolase [Mesorhizobium sp. Root102]|jgi:methylenetetrahydrofolate dehydrogenase (NADP+)/methenyltetrahydrofolate cyclohydrolase|uniref:bifunctional methylenetetrahydrofolate dehydrogenase/methenyltetrahydrofolate cyclohydrolase FolD n=1 Tax=unclassified Mesorhizobium TaxID=325217 RepID=UPI0006FA2228|nr:MULTISPECIES: bifunctional methylenetetrahydrofolate dehydrogenase/methenyltetrahydrofolate cyclohydrolase FolD [unclassified Mesorhizobium]KQU85487.1 bifunctional 5,10-methylene-tetrahydrofolate dehydrogenase/5,10-methylene-tetrahydrofolate cyclohydrolase [Mesorhizobium sp. Root102]KRB24337.1 bifunctional 5,10-methylene-tetrahydrofolate dehydrogenase/5,10-methylene-tetrahydrofolate cyclohydrolase [Mesorhizobium sp. Root172]
MSKIIDGTAVAADVLAKLKVVAQQLTRETGVVSGIAVVIVGQDPASQIYVAPEGKKAEECGFHSTEHALPTHTTEEELVALVEKLNADLGIHGILVQLPLPDRIDFGRIIQTIAPEKDVDGFPFINVGKLGTGQIDTAFVPCTPAGSMILIERVHGRDLSGFNAVVVGRSNIVGKPIANLLLHANATVTIAHSRTKNLPELCRSAEILVAAVGKPEMIKADWVKPGATVIDVGINRISGGSNGKACLVGDVAFEEAATKAGAITSVPGEVGPMTIALLMANTLTAPFRAAGRAFSLEACS